MKKIFTVIMSMLLVTANVNAGSLTVQGTQGSLYRNQGDVGADGGYDFKLNFNLSFVDAWSYTLNHVVNNDTPSADVDYAGGTVTKGTLNLDVLSLSAISVTGAQNFCTTYATELATAGALCSDASQSKYAADTLDTRVRLAFPSITMQATGPTSVQLLPQVRVIDPNGGGGFRKIELGDEVLCEFELSSPCDKDAVSAGFNDIENLKHITGSASNDITSPKPSGLALEFMVKGHEVNVDTAAEIDIVIGVSVI